MTVRRHVPSGDENLAYHAARLLLLVALTGKPQSRTGGRRPGIKGRTLLAKLDFFVRYPTYLREAAQVRGSAVTLAELGLEDGAELETVESRMVRYLYGPWDHLYYVTLAYLIGKGLLVVEIDRGTEVFRLTELGSTIVAALEGNPAFQDYTARARVAYRLFNSFSGSRLKDFIYQHFPEVVGRGIGETI